MKDIVINGVSYKLSPADYKDLLNILARGCVANHTEKTAPQVNSAPKPIAVAKASATPEKLNDAVVERLIGHTNVVYYNYETKTWNTGRYNGCKIHYLEDADTEEYALGLKASLEQDLVFSEQYEMVATVTMTIDSTSYKGFGKLVHNPKYDENGKAVAGCVIVKNKATGKYELYGKSWLCVGAYRWSYDAAVKGPTHFEYHIKNPDVQKELLQLMPYKLTDGVIGKLVGHTNIVYYNFETGTWNTNTYNGYPINGQESDPKHAHAFKAAMENLADFDGQYRMVATVIMTIDSKLFRDWEWCGTFNNPPYRPDGTAVVGNLIVKNTGTGKCELYGKSWIGVDNYRYPDVAADFGMFGFVNRGANDSDYRKKLIEMHEYSTTNIKIHLNRASKILV